MQYTVHIKRQANIESKSYWQDFGIECDESTSVAGALRELNGRTILTDINGKPADKIAYECGCMVRKCGACAMRINGIPRLACSTFLGSLKGKKLILEPLSKFPLVKDLIVDRSAIFKKLEQVSIWLEDNPFMSEQTKVQRYKSASCIMCGCCLEVCPNFTADNDFSGAIAAVNAYRILDEEQNIAHKNELSEKYKKNYYEQCGKSLACHDICPIGLPVEELIVRSNLVAIWGRQ